MRTVLLLLACFAATLAVSGDASRDQAAQAAGGTSAVDPGGAHTCALSDAGVISCWGWNFHGQLGDGSVDSRLVPTKFDLSSVTAIASGGNHTCALVDSAALCWGLNDSGQLGDGTTDTSLAPVSVTGTSYTAIAAGSSHTCAITKSESVACWGANESGQLGNLTTENNSVPKDVCGALPCEALSHIGALALGASHTCALGKSNLLRCWGSNGSGQLGDRSSCGVACARPVSVCLADLENDCVARPEIVSISAGGSHTCAVTSGRLAYCWGDNTHGQLGDGSGISSDVPVLISGLDSPIAIAAGLSFTCALSSSGDVSCWGLNSVGQLGNSAGNNSSLPVAVEGLASDIVEIAAGGSHTCVRTAAGVLQCWGWNADGRLGDGTFSNQEGPVAVIGFGDAKTVTPTPVVPSPTPAPVIAGDANCDGSVTAVDATLILQAGAGLIPTVPCPALADVDFDGQIDSIDATLVLQFVAGLVGALPSAAGSGTVDHQS